MGKEKEKVVSLPLTVTKISCTCHTSILAVSIDIAHIHVLYTTLLTTVAVCCVAVVCVCKHEGKKDVIYM